MGTPYGGWCFVDSPELFDSMILSCGLGEDASFDVEFASAYGAKVLIVDPTPRAIEHFHALEQRCGLKNDQGYGPGGNQPPRAYDLADVERGRLRLVPLALHHREGTVRFYAPIDPKHVSYSIVNFQNSYATDTPYIEVGAVTFERLMDEHAPFGFPLVKLDIEGAEVGVIPNLVSSPRAPNQLLVEFDELGQLGRMAVNHFRSCDRLLRAADYRLARFEPPSNFLYVKSSLYESSAAS